MDLRSLCQYPEWETLQRKLEGIRDEINKVVDCTTVEDLHFRRGCIEMLNSVITLPEQVSEIIAGNFEDNILED